MARGRRKQAAVNAADQPVFVEDVEQSGGEEGAAEDVAEAELETIASRVVSRAKRSHNRKILLHDGEFIAFSSCDTYPVDPEIGYHLAEVEEVVPDEDNAVQDGNGHGSLIRIFLYFDREIGRHGCVWMPLGTSEIYTRSCTWTRVTAIGGLNKGHATVSWPEHSRIQNE